MRRKPTVAGAGAKPLTWNVDEIPMKVPSRRMPAAPVHKTPVRAWLFLAALLAGFTGWLWQQPYLVGVLLAVFGVCVGIQLVWDTRSRRRLAVARQGGSICQFARSFDRSADTWLIRAVYEEISRHLSVDGRAVPVRRQDRCEKDLRIDPDDLDDIARDVAFRARRSMEGVEKNPLYGQVQTVGDLVSFLEHQPRIVKREVSPDDDSAMIAS